MNRTARLSAFTSAWAFDVSDERTTTAKDDHTRCCIFRSAGNDQGALSLSGMMIYPLAVALGAPINLTNAAAGLGAGEA